MRKIIFYLILSSSFLLTSCRNETRPAPTEFVYFDDELRQSKFYSPIYNDRYEPNTNLEIRWKSANQNDNVSIQLYRKSELRMSIAERTKDIGAYQWRIPRDIVYSRHYKIKIKDIWNDDQSITSEEFYIGY